MAGQEAISDRPQKRLRGGGEQTQDDSGWLTVSDELIYPTAEEMAWLKEHTDVRELCVPVYTGAKTMDRQTGRSCYTKAKPTTLGIGGKSCPTPDLSVGWSDVTLTLWTPPLGHRDGKASFGFQRVCVEFPALPARQFPGSRYVASFFPSLQQPDADAVRILVQWNPSLALKHMCCMMGLPISRATLQCSITPVQPEAWRPPTYEEYFLDEAGDEFFLLGCAAEAPAAQPPRFQRFQLRAEQLRSLRWMINREANGVEFNTQAKSRVVPGVCWDSQPHSCATYEYVCFPDYWQGYETRSGFTWCYEADAHVTFNLSGGVLGDAIGSGKTATLIGLLDSQRQQDAHFSASDLEKRQKLSTKATLILVPSNLLGQWQDEFNKFLGTAAFKVVVIRSISDIACLTAEDLMNCEVVLASYKILYSPNYIERLKSLQCSRSNRLHERSFLGKPIETTLEVVENLLGEVLLKGAEEVGWTMRAKNHAEQVEARENETDSSALLSSEDAETRISQLGLCKDVRTMKCPVFELFFWNRIVFDEFHELEAMDKRRLCMLENLRCRHRWGLTGTPPKRDRSQIWQLARLLRVQVDEKDHSQCQHFLSTFVRQNFSELPEIPVEEHVIHVEHTLEERALYLQRSFDGTRRSLLQFCSHHHLDHSENGASAHESNATAKASLAQMEILKREAYQKHKKVVENDYKILAALSSFKADTDSKLEAEAAEKLSQIQDRARSMQHADLDQFLVALQSHSLHQKAQEALGLVDMARPGSNAIMGALRAISRDLRPQLAQIRAARTTQLSRCASGVAKLLQMARSSRFFEATLSVLRSADAGHEAPECSVCLEPMNANTATVLPCAHAFHMSCITAAFASNIKSCPTCRDPFRLSDAMMISAASGGGSNSGVSRHDVERFGSKLALVAKTLRDIHEKEPASKAIVFVQWKGLEILVSEALEGLGIEHARLQGTAVQRSRLLANFQNTPTPRVLLQSLENSASGANLTRASHVLLVHPMDADSPDRAVAYEMQALGRVRRCGQEADRVHLYRFVTRGTVEEDISKEHQLGLLDGIHAAGAFNHAANSGA